MEEVCEVAVAWAAGGFIVRVCGCHRAGCLSHLCIYKQYRFDRKSVSFQLSKNDSIHSWLKYKEGFSAELVRNLISEFKLQPDDTILDPFMGSGTTALVASAREHQQHRL